MRCRDVIACHAKSRKRSINIYNTKHTFTKATLYNSKHTCTKVTYIPFPRPLNAATLASRPGRECSRRAAIFCGAGGVLRRLVPGSGPQVTSTPPPPPQTHKQCCYVRTNVFFVICIHGFLPLLTSHSPPHRPPPKPFTFMFLSTCFFIRYFFPFCTYPLYTFTSAFFISSHFSFIFDFLLLFLIFPSDASCKKWSLGWLAIDVLNHDATLQFFSVSIENVFFFSNFCCRVQYKLCASIFFLSEL